MLLAVILLLVFYWGFILFSIRGWLKALDQVVPKIKRTEPGFSIEVLIPFRNESGNLPSLLNDLKNQTDSLEGVQFIFINDYSEDNGADIIKSYADALPLSLIENEGIGKKAAISVGLRYTSAAHVLFWDADIRISPDYFTVLRQTPMSSMVILPVVPVYTHGFWSRYAALDFLSLIGMTFSFAAIHRPIMANSANLIIESRSYVQDKVTASGDDIQALHHLKSEGKKISFSLDEQLIVRTAMPSSWAEFLEQRLRWAAKSRGYKDQDTLLIGWFMVFFHTSFSLMCILLLVYNDFKSLGLLVAAKALADFIFLHLVTKRFCTRGLLTILPLASVLNSFLMPLIFIVSRSRNFIWKGRSYSA